MAHRPYSKIIHKEESEHQKQLAKAMVKLHYGGFGKTTDGTTPGESTYTAADVAAAKAKAAAWAEAHRGEGEEGAVPGEGEAAGLEPGAVLSGIDAMEETRQWLRGAKLTKLIAVFEEDEVDLDSIRGLEDDEVEPWINEQPLNTMQKKRLRKAVATLRAESKAAKDESMEEAKVEDISKSVATTSPGAADYDLFKGFRFSTTLKGKSTCPDYYNVSNEGRTAHVLVSNGYGRGICLMGAVPKYTEVVFKVESVGRIFYVGLVDSVHDVVQHHSVRSDGVVHENGKDVGNIGRSVDAGDLISLDVNLETGSINYTITGERSTVTKRVNCKFKYKPVYFAFTGFMGSKLTIV